MVDNCDNTPSELDILLGNIYSFINVNAHWLLSTSTYTTAVFHIIFLLLVYNAVALVI